MEEALERQDFDKLSEGIGQEWIARQKLAPTIATPEMLAAMNAAKDAGATAAKVCGAGGGGCFIVVAPEEKRGAAVAALKKSGVTVIDYKVVDTPCKADTL